MNKNFLAIEKDIHDFAQGLYFRNEAAAKESKIFKVMNEAYDEL